MNTPVTVTVSMSSALGVNIIKKYYTGKAPSGFMHVFAFNTLAGVASALTFLLWGGIGSASIFTVLLGALFGAVVTFQGLFMLKAIQVGPISLTTVIVSFSTVITALSGAIFWGEKIKALQIVGIVLMLASFYFSINKEEKQKKASLKWLLFCILALIGSGGIGLMQKIHQNTEYKGEVNAFLITAFAVGSVLSLALLLISKTRSNEPAFLKSANGKISWLVIVLIMLTGILTAVNHKLNLYLSGVMDSAVFFPLINGGNLVLVTLSALIFFRERLSVKQWISVAIGITSVLCLCL